MARERSAYDKFVNAVETIGFLEKVDVAVYHRFDEFYNEIRNHVGTMESRKDEVSAELEEKNILEEQKRTRIEEIVKIFD